MKWLREKGKVIKGKKSFTVSRVGSGVMDKNVELTMIYH